MAAAVSLAVREGVALNQLIEVAVENVPALRTETYLADRAERGKAAQTMDILKRAERADG